LLRPFITLPCKKKKKKKKNVTKLLFRCLAELPEKEPVNRALMLKVGDFQLFLVGRKWQRLYLFPVKQCKVSA